MSCQSHNVLYARFVEEFGFDSGTPDADARLLRALDALEKERNHHLKRLRALDMKRAKAKTRVRRTLSGAEREELDAIRRDDCSGSG